MSSPGKILWLHILALVIMIWAVCPSIIPIAFVILLLYLLLQALSHSVPITACIWRRLGSSNDNSTPPSSPHQYHEATNASIHGKDNNDDSGYESGSDSKLRSDNNWHDTSLLIPGSFHGHEDTTFTQKPRLPDFSHIKLMNGGSHGSNQGGVVVVMSAAVSGGGNGIGESNGDNNHNDDKKSSKKGKATKKKKCGCIWARLTRDDGTTHNCRVHKCGSENCRYRDWNDHP